MSKTHIALLMMLKNEEKRIKSSLESIIGHVDSMIIYDTSFLFVVILCGDEYIVINIDTFTFTLLSSMNALFEYLEMHLTSTFQMGSAYSLRYR